MSLPKTIKPPYSLFNFHWIPRKVIIEYYIAELKV